MLVAFPDDFMLAVPSKDVSSNMCTASDSYRACAKSHPGIRSPSIHSREYNDSVTCSGQGMP